MVKIFDLFYMFVYSFMMTHHTIMLIMAGAAIGGDGFFPVTIQTGVHAVGELGIRGGMAAGAIEAGTGVLAVVKVNMCRQRGRAHPMEGLTCVGGGMWVGRCVEGG